VNNSPLCRVVWPGLAATLLALLAGPEPAARADVKLPAIFGPHMVLQRDQQDRVWGWAEPGEEVTVEIGGRSKTARAGPDGRWQVVLDAMPAGGPHTMTIRGKNTVQLDDVLVGEVWICSGQSNMQWPVAASKDADLEIPTAKYPSIRLIAVPNVGTQEPQKDFRGQWRLCRPDTVPGFSAVGYFFGRQLHQTLGVPIGLINDAWGGSACEAWIRRDLLAADEKYAPLLRKWEQTEKDYPRLKKDYPRLKAEYDEWKRAAGQGTAAGTKADDKRPPGNPDDMMRGNARPGNIYNGVLKPTIGYGIRGVIWYQGESNAGRAYQYRELFPLMIKSWRDEWGQGDFSFYWVQLADFLDETTEPKPSAWAELREAQTMTLGRLPHTGQAVIIDIGEGKDIHPKDKQDVAQRLARWALARDYGIPVACQSPTYKTIAIQGNKAVLTFDHVGGGLQTFDVRQPRGFAIAGSDRKFVLAEARIAGQDTVEVWSDQVAEPVAVRYAWADNPVCNLYSAEGLPATPFRTDDWPGVTIHNLQ
jgi:sialate O-acetylesterase